MTTFGQTIKQVREQAGLTQEALGAKLSPKAITGEYITQIEKHGAIPGVKIIVGLSKALGLDIDAMLRMALKEKDPELYKAFHVEEPISPYGISEDDLEIARMAHPLTDEEKAELKEWIAFKKARKAKAA